MAFIDLDGTWSLSNGTGASYLATVPGQVHMDLLSNGVIGTSLGVPLRNNQNRVKTTTTTTTQTPPNSGDPYYRFNDVDYQWIALSNWTYTRAFTLPTDVLAFDIVRDLARLG